MKITLLCSDPKHPINSYLNPWVQKQAGVHNVELVHNKLKLGGGDILFLVSCSEIISIADRAKYRKVLALHASDLPKGRGWSPHIWELIQGANNITLSLFEVEDKVDNGCIWQKKLIMIPKHALWYEINHLLFTAEIDLINYAVNNFNSCVPQMQKELDSASYYPKRSPKDSEIDPYKSIAEQFDLIRVCDPNRFPVYFQYLGQRYILKLEKSGE